MLTVFRTGEHMPRVNAIMTGHSLRLATDHTRIELNTSILVNNSHEAGVFTGHTCHPEARGDIEDVASDLQCFAAGKQC